MKVVELPWFRLNILQAFASLADAEHQTPEWFWWGITAGDSLTEVIHILYDGMGGFPTPEDHPGAVFFEGREMERAKDLANALTPVIADYPGDDMRALAQDPRWAEVVALAGRALAEMVQNWGLPFWED